MNRYNVDFLGASLPFSDAKSISSPLFPILGTKVSYNPHRDPLLVLCTNLQQNKEHDMKRIVA